MLAPAQTVTPNRSAADLESMLTVARLEALTVLRAQLSADPETPAHILRERRLAAVAILRIPATPARERGVSPSTSPARRQGTSPAETPKTPAPQPAAGSTPIDSPAQPRILPPEQRHSPPNRAPKLKSSKSIYARVQERLKSATPQTESSSG